MKPAPTSFSKYLGRSSWYQIYGLFMGSSDVQPTLLIEKIMHNEPEFHYLLKK